MPFCRRLEDVAKNSPEKQIFHENIFAFRFWEKCGVTHCNISFGDFWALLLPLKSEWWRRKGELIIKGLGGKLTTVEFCLTWSWCLAWKYCVQLDQVCSAWLNKGLLCLYILKKLRLGRVTPIPDTLTHKHQNIVLLCLSKV